MTFTKTTAFAVLDGTVCVHCLTELTDKNKIPIGAEWCADPYDIAPCRSCWDAVEKTRDEEDEAGEEKWGEECRANIDSALVFEEEYRELDDLACGNCGRGMTKEEVDAIPSGERWDDFHICKNCDCP